MSKIKIGDNNVIKQVRFTFDNGLDVSVIFGKGSYSSTRHIQTNSSEDVEIAIFNKNKFVTEKFYAIYMKEKIDDDVVGYVKVDDLVTLLAIVRDAVWDGGDEE
jgi:hypothetical protein